MEKNVRRSSYYGVNLIGIDLTDRELTFRLGITVFRLTLPFVRANTVVDDEIAHGRYGARLWMTALSLNLLSKMMENALEQLILTIDHLFRTGSYQPLYGLISMHYLQLRKKHLLLSIVHIQSWLTRSRGQWASWLASTCRFLLTTCDWFRYSLSWVDSGSSAKW